MNHGLCRLALIVIGARGGPLQPDITFPMQERSFPQVHIHRWGWNLGMWPGRRDIVECVDSWEPRPPVICSESKQLHTGPDADSAPDGSNTCTVLDTARACEVLLVQVQTTQLVIRAHHLAAELYLGQLRDHVLAHWNRGPGIRAFLRRHVQL